MPFYVEDLTINDGNLPADESTKEFDIKIGCDWAKLRSLKVVQLNEGPLSVTIEVWEKDGDGYDPSDRTKWYLRLLRRTIAQTIEQGASYHEIINPELLYFDRDKTGEIHCRLINHSEGTASDFAIVFKMGEVGEAL